MYSLLADLLTKRIPYLLSVGSGWYACFYAGRAINLPVGGGRHR